MNSKLIINLENTILENAKNYAEMNGIQISDLIEKYLKDLPIETKNIKQDDIPKYLKMRGAFKIPENFKYNYDLQNSLLRKYFENE